MGLSWLQPMYSFPVTEDAQRPDGEHILGTSKGNHTGIVTEQCISIAVCIYIIFFFWLILSYTCIVLCNIFCIAPLNQKSCVTSAIFK